MQFPSYLLLGALMINYWLFMASSETACPISRVSNWGLVLSKLLRACHGILSVKSMFVYMSSGILSYNKLLLQRLIRVKMLRIIVCWMITPKKNINGLVTQAQRTSPHRTRKTARAEWRRKSIEYCPLGMDRTIAFLNFQQLWFPSLAQNWAT